MMFKARLATLLCPIALLSLNGCMTTGYSTAKNPDMVRKFDVTIIEIAPQNIYNSLGVSLVGPLAPVEHVGEKVRFKDATGAEATIVQPKSSRYELHAGDKAIYIVDRGQVWIQPTDYPLPPEFSMPAK